MGPPANNQCPYKKKRRQDEEEIRCDDTVKDDYPPERHGGRP